MNTAQEFLIMLHKESEGSAHFKVGYLESLLADLASIPEVQRELEAKLKAYKACQTGA